MGSVCRPAGLVASCSSENGRAELLTLVREGMLGKGGGGLFIVVLGSFKKHSLFLSPLTIQINVALQKKKKTTLSVTLSLRAARVLIFQRGTFSRTERYLLRGHVSRCCWGFCCHIECFL